MVSISPFYQNLLSIRSHDLLRNNVMVIHVALVREAIDMTIAHIYISK